MHLEEPIITYLNELVHAASERNLDPGDYRQLCESLQVAKMYYDMDLGGGDRYRDQRTQKLVIESQEQENKIILFDNGEPTGEKMVYTYYYNGEQEYVHAYIELRQGIRWEDLDSEVYQFMADMIYLIVSRQNMRFMLDFAEATDVQTGIPNSALIRKKYGEIVKRVSPEDILVLYVNLQNFKYVNEVGGAKCGDEVIIRYARLLLNSVTEDECVCRMGGDNFGLFIYKDHLDGLMEKLKCVSVGDLQTMPGRHFEITPWIGISQGKPDDRRPFGARLEEASTACNMGKRVFKKNVVFFSEQLMGQIARGHEIIAMFHPAVKNQEFRPFFQAKVNMQTGALVGFEALCRWIHEGQFIYPDQFIPVLDREGLIHELDMEIFRGTCQAIKTWKDQGLQPPRVSSNFSRKNLFVPDIEKKIYYTMEAYGLAPEDIEIEITESIKESEYNRLIDFVRQLKQYGLHIAVDDFGTGYSSMALIHNIDADVIKIDKSFVDEVPGNSKSEILIESIVSIANRLHMSVIAEGVETAEQGQGLLRLGCQYAQGYYYSKPVDFGTATELIRMPSFAAIAITEGSSGSHCIPARIGCLF